MTTHRTTFEKSLSMRWHTPRGRAVRARLPQLLRSATRAELVAWLEPLRRRGVVDDDLDLRGIDLRGADLRGANLTRVDLRHADLRHVDLEGAELSGALIEGAELEGTALADPVGASIEAAWPTPSQGTVTVDALFTRLAEESGQVA